MKDTEQTLLDQIKNDVAKEKGFNDYESFLSHDMNNILAMDSFMNVVCERYATAKAQASCEATLKKASEVACVRGYCKGCEAVGLLHCAHADTCGNNQIIVDRSSIAHPSNITIV